MQQDVVASILHQRSLPDRAALSVGPERRLSLDVLTSAANSSETSDREKRPVLPHTGAVCSRLDVDNGVPLSLSGLYARQLDAGE
jgi:hypothetical protein